LPSRPLDVREAGESIAIATSSSRKTTMQVVITAVGPDNRGLADPIIHHVTSVGANISEIQMYDHDEQSLFAMLSRVELPGEAWGGLREALVTIGHQKGLSVRVWSPQERSQRPRLAICTTFRPEPALALLRAIRDGRVAAEAAVMLGNRANCRSLAEQFDVPWHLIGDANGAADDERLIELCDQYEIDYLILARYMRVLPPATCWKYAGGRIVNLHHGLLPSFPGIRPYHEAFASRMLTYGATCHFIVPELDAGNQIIYQSTFTVSHTMKLDEIMRRGHEDNEPHCLVEGVRRVVSGEVRLHFHRVVAR
jgi:formyltetrahydrofolate deformylase